MAGLTTYPLTSDRWEDLVTVFGGGDGKGDCGRCWCMWWRLSRASVTEGLGKENKALFKKRVAAGPPPGLVGYDAADGPVGWVQVGPRADVPNWNQHRRLSAPLDPRDASDPGVWGISCFVVRAGFRRRGYFSGLLDAARQRIGRRATLLECEAAKLPFDDTSFQLATSTSTLHYLPDAIAALQEIRRVISPSGNLQRPA